MKRGRKPICLYCKSKRTISKGYRPTVTIGRRSLRVCKDCGRKFTVGRTQVVAAAVGVAAPEVESTVEAQMLVPIAATPPAPVEQRSDSDLARP
jgi:hypothetical protein